MRAMRLAALGAAVLPVSAADIYRRDLVPLKTPQKGWGYVGCFVDSVEERALDLARHYDTEALTGKSCVEWCSDNGYTYAGTEYSAECFCGNNRPATKADDEDCDMPCTGDDEQPCGSANRLTVYTSDIMAPAAAGWKYSGCYADSPAKRVLTGDYYADTDDMTPETCIEFCEDGNFKYAGVEFGAECFCGNKLPSTKEDDDECDMSCPGDAERTCGAGNRLSLYVSDADAPPEPGAPPEIEGWLYAGCIKEGSGGRVLTHQVFLSGGANTMTNELCVAACDAQDYKYAGTEYAGECFCGDEYENDGGELVDEGCNMKCLGNRLQFCGGSSRLSAWSVNDLPPPDTDTTSVASSTVSETGSETEIATETATETDTETEAETETGTGTAVTETEAQTSSAETQTDTDSETTTSAPETDNEVSSTEVEVATETSTESESATETEAATETATATETEAATEVEATTETEAATETDAATETGLLSETISITLVSGTETEAAETDTATATEEETEASSTVAETSSSAAAATGLPEGWAYKGCYVDPPNRAMAGAPGSPSRDMTPEKCIATCIAEGFIIAGLEYSEECFCGNALNNGAPKTSESDCNMPCAGDDSQMCGAGNRLSIYSDGDFPVWPVPKVQDEDLPGDWEYKGCVFDNANPYVLEWLWEDSVDYASSKMTIPLCLKRCQKFGYSAAGVEYGRQCVCGDLGKVEERGDIYKDDGFCSMPCPGDRNYTCGAGNHISYYEWAGEPLNTFHYASGYKAGQYDHFSTAPLVPLISSVGINDKIVFVEKHGTSLDDTEGSFEFDYTTNTYRELALKTDVFCSASFTLPDKAGRMINIGGWSAESIYGIRFFTPDSPQGLDNGTNVWEEDYSQLRLFDPRWYPTALVLSNGSLLAMGGESGSDAPIVPSAEVLPHPPGVTESIYLDYLARAEAIGRTNSYPHMAILPSGDIFFTQFNESRIISQVDFQTIRKLPDMPGSPVNGLTGRNYPLQGTMMIMPQKAPYGAPLEVVLCGGTTHEPGNDALDNCVSMEPDTAGSEWAIERMPSKRVMPTMIALPDGRYLICNGAHVGRGGFGLADDANLNAVMYDPEEPIGSRMTVLANTTIARLYHSEGVLLSDGKVLISGSDPQDQGKHPQEKRIEYFVPDYLLSGAAQPTFTMDERDWAYDGSYDFEITSPLAEGMGKMRVSLLASIGSTHGITMGQRTLFPSFSCEGTTCTVQAPPNAFVSPPSWYQMFVLDGPTPSHAIWVRIGGDPAGLGDWPKLPGFTTPGV